MLYVIWISYVVIFLAVLFAVTSLRCLFCHELNSFAFLSGSSLSPDCSQLSCRNDTSQVIALPKRSRLYKSTQLCAGSCTSKWFKCPLCRCFLALDNDLLQLECINVPFLHKKSGNISFISVYGLWINIGLTAHVRLNKCSLCFLHIVFCVLLQSASRITVLYTRIGNLLREAENRVVWSWIGGGRTDHRKGGGGGVINAFPLPPFFLSVPFTCPFQARSFNTMSFYRFAGHVKVNKVLYGDSGTILRFGTLSQCSTTLGVLQPKEAIKRHSRNSTLLFVRISTMPQGFQFWPTKGNVLHTYGL